MECENIWNIGEESIKSRIFHYLDIFSFYVYAQKKARIGGFLSRALPTSVETLDFSIFLFLLVFCDVLNHQ